MKKFFAISKLAKNQFLNWEKFRTAKKCNFTKNDLFDFKNFFSWTFFKVTSQHGKYHILDIGTHLLHLHMEIVTLSIPIIIKMT